MRPTVRRGREPEENASSQALGSPERFTFAIPLIAKASARSWPRVDELLGLCLRSVLSQTDGDFEVLLAGHDEPDSWKDLTRGDGRFQFIQARWRPEAPSVGNDDGGCKKWIMHREVTRRGGGLLMYLDADDLVDRQLVRVARREIGPEHVGAVIGRGVAIDFVTLRAAPLPHSSVFEGEFHQVCGSSTIGRVEPGNPSALRRDPHGALGSHHQWPEAAERAGVALAWLPVCGAYFINTCENHSELHGPFAEWRRAFSRAVSAYGSAVGPELATTFGLDLDLLKASGGARLRRRHESYERSSPVADHLLDH